MKARRRLVMDTPELNLVPLLDMVSLLIQLLLINAQFGVFAEIGAVLGAPSAEPGQGLQLQVHVTGSGFQVSWEAGGGRESKVLPCSGDGSCAGVESYDAAGLAAVAGELAREFPEEQQVQVRLDPEVSFEVAAKVMDAVRGPDGTGFPDVVLGGT
jgi:biopolymer transport protein ExbD